MISLLCPTRGRPTGVREFAESALGTAAGAVEIVFVADSDDAEGASAIRLLDREHPHVTSVIVDERLVLSEYWNLAAAIASGSILGHMGDDIRFRTPGWDQAVRGAFAHFPDRIAFVYGDDGNQHEALGTHGFLSREWVSTVGYFVPPYFSSDMNDLWLHEVAGALNRRVYLPEVVTDHLHPDFGKGELDATHRERIERGARDRVGEMYARLHSERVADAEKLRAVMT